MPRPRCLTLCFMQSDSHTNEKRDAGEPPKVPAETKNPNRIIIPECCREGWDSCKHVVKPFKKTKQNIGL